MITKISIGLLVVLIFSGIGLAQDPLPVKPDGGARENLSLHPGNRIRYLCSDMESRLWTLYGSCNSHLRSGLAPPPRYYDSAMSRTKLAYSVDPKKLDQDRYGLIAVLENYHIEKKGNPK